MALSDQVAAVKAQVLKMKLADVIFNVQALDKFNGQVSVAGDGTVNINGRSLTNYEHFLLGQQLGVV